MKISFFLAVLLINAAISFAQTVNPTPEMSEKELKAQIQKAFEKRDRILSKPQVIYYSPVINPSADRIAYVRRTVEYRLTGGGLIRFLSDAPTVQWISDEIEVCTRDLATGAEQVILKRSLPKPSPSLEVGTVFVYMDWRERLYYDVNLSNYDMRAIPEGKHCRGSGVCISNKYLYKQGAKSAGGITVDLNMNSQEYRYPMSNSIVISCEKTVIRCPRF